MCKLGQAIERPNLNCKCGIDITNRTVFVVLSLNIDAEKEKHFFIYIYKNS